MKTCINIDSDLLRTDINAVVYLFSVVAKIEVEHPYLTTFGLWKKIEDYLKADVPFLAFTDERCLQLYQILRILLTSSNFRGVPSIITKNSYKLHTTLFHLNDRSDIKFSEVLLDPELFSAAGQMTPMLLALNRKPYLRHFASHLSSNAVAEAVSVLSDPNKYYSGLSRGFLTVLSGPKRKELTSSSNLNCICKLCSSNVNLTREEFSRSIACPACQSVLELASPWDKRSAEAHALKHMNARVVEVEKISRACASIAIPKEAAVRKAELVDRIGLYPTLSKLRADKTVRLVSERWQFEDAAELLQFAGLPLTPTDELHRRGHENDYVTYETPYSPTNCQWLPKRINCQKKRTNSQIRLDGMIFDSAKAACTFAGLSYDALRSSMRRAKQAGSPLPAQAAFDQLRAAQS